MKLAYFDHKYRISKATKNWSVQFIGTEVTAVVDKYFPLWKVPNLMYLYLQPPEGYCIYHVDGWSNYDCLCANPNHKNLLFSSYQLGFYDTSLKLNQSKLHHQECLLYV